MKESRFAVGTERTAAIYNRTYTIYGSEGHLPRQGPAMSCRRCRRCRRRRCRCRRRRCWPRVALQGMPCGLQQVEPEQVHKTKTKNHIYICQKKFSNGLVFLLCIDISTGAPTPHRPSLIPHENRRKLVHFRGRCSQEHAAAAAAAAASSKSLRQEDFRPN